MRKSKHSIPENVFAWTSLSLALAFSSSILMIILDADNFQALIIGLLIFLCSSLLQLIFLISQFKRKAENIIEDTRDRVLVESRFAVLKSNSSLLNKIEGIAKKCSDILDENFNHIEEKSGIPSLFYKEAFNALDSCLATLSDLSRGSLNISTRTC